MLQRLDVGVHVKWLIQSLEPRKCSRNPGCLLLFLSLLLLSCPSYLQCLEHCLAYNRYSILGNEKIKISQQMFILRLMNPKGQKIPGKMIELCGLGFQTLGLFLPFTSTGKGNSSAMLEISSIGIAL